MRGGVLLVAVAGILATLTSCGGGAAAPDAASPDAFVTICGRPGDVGNSVGVGLFCRSIEDCRDTFNAPLCANIGDPQAHFCTNACNPDIDAGTPQCGEGATCVCGDGGCGCTPDACL